MAKASTFEKRLAALEKTITDFFRGGSSETPQRKSKSKRKSGGKSKKTARKTAKKSAKRRR